MTLVADHKFTWLSEEAKRLLGHLSIKFTPAVYRFITHTLEHEHTNRSQLMSQLTKQSQLVPNLVERIESVDVVLGKIIKPCKSDNVQNFIKRNATRDFKINVRALGDVIDRKKEREAEKKRKNTTKATTARKKKKAV